MKKIIVFAIAACLVLASCMAFAACDTPNGVGDATAEVTTAAATEAPTEEKTEAPETGTYTLTVKDEDNNPIAGVEVQICIGETCLMPRATDAEGKVVFKNINNENSDPLMLQINGENSPAGYVYPTEKIAIGADETDINLTIEKAE